MNLATLNMIKSSTLFKLQSVPKKKTYMPGLPGVDPALRKAYGHSTAECVTPAKS